MNILMLFYVLIIPGKHPKMKKNVVLIEEKNVIFYMKAHIFCAQKLELFYFLEF